MKKRKRLILLLFTVVIIVACIIGWQLFGPTISAPEGNYFYIRTGATYQNIKDSLTKKNVLKSTGLFDRVAKYLHYDRSVKPGKYKITDGMSLVSLIRMLRS